MTNMLPAVPGSARSITGVASDLRGALSGGASGLRPVRSAVLVVIDGLGAGQLRAHAGHARRLSGAMAKKDVALSVFPSTTASALTSILTGVAPGAHGLVGYRVLDRAGGRLVNQLSGWEEGRIDAATWQPEPTVFEQARAEGRPAFAVGLAAYATSGFTAATLRGAEFRSAATPAERVELSYQLAAENEGALVYCYLPEADQAGHKRGVASSRWVAAVEDIDAALGFRAPDGTGVLVTADHGMVDVPRHRHLVVEDGDRMLTGVAHIGGEPRMLHLYLDDPARLPEVHAAWAEGTEGIADVVTRDQAVAGGMLGPVVTDAASSRLGDLLVMARGSWAIYDGREEDQRSQDMIGQHGSITPEETRVPWIRLGAFAVG
ncbi:MULTISPECIES: alkaline phosphatase family protein [Bacteria]|uniref:alkaline phosphatase family protein n=1 Tax=Bacteria TaxID=2 RepID=UPI003C7D4A47